jgi:hypothetical protein
MDRAPRILGVGIGVCSLLLAFALAARAEVGLPPGAALAPVPQGATIPFQTIEQGSNSGYAEAASFVIRNHEDWAALWERAHAKMFPVPPLPPIDFSQQMVVAVFQGSRSSGGYRIEVTALVDTGAALEIAVRTSSPGRGCATTTAFTEPYHLVQTDRLDRDAVFTYDEVVTHCDAP